MQQVQVGNSAFPGDSKVWVAPPSRAPLEQGSDAEDNTDASSTASTSSSLVLSNLRIAPITAPTAKPLVSALKSSTSDPRPKQRGLKKLMGRNKKKSKRVRFTNATTPTAIPSLLPDDDEQLSHVERKRRTWYSGLEVRAFQAATDELALQADAQAEDDPNSWPAMYQALYEATVRGNDAATVTRILKQAKKLHDSRDVAMLHHLDDLIGMERLASTHVLLDSKRRRRQHQRSVLDTQNCAPYNNANRLRKAIVAASLKSSGPAQAWAACVAQMVALS